MTSAPALALVAPDEDPGVPPDAVENTPGEQSTAFVRQLRACLRQHLVEQRARQFQSGKWG